jgi:LysR family nitrogen assimilation transcriptional regulator
LHLRTLRNFIAVADAGSLTAAAVAIPIAQPALTRQLRELERDEPPRSSQPRRAASE